MKGSRLKRVSKGWKKLDDNFWRMDRDTAIGIERFSSKYVRGKGFEYNNYGVVLYKNGRERLLVNPDKTKAQALAYAEKYMKRK